MPFAFPLALEVTGRRCVVTGGGSTAVAKAGALLDAGAAVAVIVVGAELARLPEAVAAADLPGPALLVVGDVVRLSDRIAWFGGGAGISRLQDRIP